MTIRPERNGRWAGRTHRRGYEARSLRKSGPSGLPILMLAKSGITRWRASRTHTFNGIEARSDIAIREHPSCCTYWTTRSARDIIADGRARDPPSVEALR